MGVSSVKIILLLVVVVLLRIYYLEGTNSKITVFVCFQNITEIVKKIKSLYGFGGNRSCHKITNVCMDL